MINDHLVWYLEKHKLLTPVQCGFRKHRSTADHLVCLETFLHEVFIQLQHAVAVFSTLQKHTIQYGNMESCRISNVLACGADYLPLSKGFLKIETSK